MSTSFSHKDHEWVHALEGELGFGAQQRAHEELSRYLSSVIQFYLINRQPDLLWLSNLASQEIACLTQDLVQICLMKLSQDNYAKLHQYSGAGSFKGWVSQIALNVARSDLRKVRWDRRLPLDSVRFLPLDKSTSPEQTLQQKQLSIILHSCLAQLSEHHRTVLVRCVMNDEPTADVARDLCRTNQAIYNLINRAKKHLRELLAQANVHADDLNLFSR